MAAKLQSHLARNLVGTAVFVKLDSVMAEPRDSDATLMLRVKQGDREAFEALVDKYKQPVMNMIFRIIADATEAEDLAQQVFIQVYKSAHRYEVSARFSTWIFTITRNLCLNEIRRRTRHPAESMESGASEAKDQPPRQFEDTKTFTPPESLLLGELEEKIEQALARLPESQRTALMLCQQGELSYEEISEVMDCSVSATKSLIHRARETLKALLKPYVRTGAWQQETTQNKKQL